MPSYFLCVVYAWGHPNIIKTYRRASKHMGDVQTYGGIQTYAGHPNIWGCPNIQGTFLHAFLSHKVGFATSVYIINVLSKL